MSSTNASSPSASAAVLTVANKVTPDTTPGGDSGDGADAVRIGAAPPKAFDTSAELRTAVGAWCEGATAKETVSETYGHVIGSWDVSRITDMSYLFQNAKSFRCDLSEWDTSNVTNMAGMFLGASSFNGDVSDWDVSGVTNMGEMFYGAWTFNRDLSRWDTSRVANRNLTFIDASAFDNGDGDISGWGFDLSGKNTDHDCGDISGWGWDIAKVHKGTRVIGV
jgi:surface protein